MIDWPYLESLVFRTRYMIAAQLMTNCPAVIEIGGSGILDYLPGHRLFTICVDPRFPEWLQRGPTRTADFDWWLNKNFQECMDMFPASDFGLVCLGMEIKGDFQPFIELVDRSRVAVIEFPPDFEPSLNQFNQLCAGTSKRIDMHIKMDFSDNDFSRLTGHPVRPIREMYVFK